MTSSRCPGCRARIRDTDAWCTLCHTRLAPAAADGPEGTPARPLAPLTSDALVGGTLPPDVLDHLEFTLRSDVATTGDARGLRAHALEGRQQAVLAAAGVAVVLVVLLVGMTLAGLLL